MPTSEKRKNARATTKNKKAVARIQAYRASRGPIWKLDNRRNQIRQKHGWHYYAGKHRRIGMDTEAKEIEELREKLHSWNHEYYVWAAPTVSDADYDRAFRRLQELETKRPELYESNSPTQRVGSPEVSVFPKIEHRVRMLSLAKAHTAEEVVNFFPKDTIGLAEPKVDGVSLSLYYHRGSLTQAVTRGDGSRGDDVTLNARTIMNIPLVLPKRVSMEVRGEVYMRWSDFDTYNKELAEAGEELAANPRNAAAGALKLKFSTEAAKRRLSFMAYSVIGELKGCKTQDAVLEELEVLKFSTTSSPPLPKEDCESMTQFGVNLSDLGAVQELISRLDKSRKVQDFPTDGLVFKINDLDMQVELGSGTTAPKWAIAFKYPPEQVKTTINAISVTVGKTGKLTPVAEFKPVPISGSVVTFASLCNHDEIKRLGVNIGDEVYVEKSSEIIPKVVGLAAKHSDGVFDMKATCPSCSSPVSRPEGMVDYFCFNSTCPEQARARLTFATGKSALDVDGCGESVIFALMQQGVTKLSELYALENPELGVAAKKRFLSAREKSKEQPFWRKLHALCVEGLGKTSCQELAARWPGLTKLLDALDDEAKPVLKLLRNVKHQSLVAWLDVNGDELVALVNLGLFKEEAQGKAVNAKIAGKSFCITGNLCVQRSKAEELVLEAGGLVRGSVTSKLDYLVVGEGGGVNKARDAARHNTPCLTESEFWTMMGFCPESVPKVNPDHEY